MLLVWIYRRGPMANSSSDRSRTDEGIQCLVPEFNALIVLYFPYRGLQQVWNFLSSLHTRSSKMSFCLKFVFQHFINVLNVSQFLTPSKLYLEYSYPHQKPFYHQTWFLVTLAAGSVVIITLLVAVLCVKSKSYKYKRNLLKLIYFS